MPKTSIPQMANIARIQIGYSTQEDLAEQWGEGETTIGGHPNSGRVWRVSGTAWVVQTDAWEYSKRGMVVDELTLGECSEVGDVPYTKLGAKEFTWMGAISAGMRKGEVMEVIKRNGLPVTQTEGGVEIRADGFNAVGGGSRGLKRWVAAFQFTGDSLSGISLYAKE